MGKRGESLLLLRSKKGSTPKRMSQNDAVFMQRLFVVCTEALNRGFYKKGHIKGKIGGHLGLPDIN